jgi:hypothetical protein
VARHRSNAGDEARPLESSATASLKAPKASASWAGE